MRKIIFKFLRYSGLPFLFQNCIQKNKVTILMFHDISKETAEKTFLYLLKKYNIIDLNEFIEAHESNDKNRIPKKALIITFDDGHIRNYELLPIIKRYNIPITIFLCSSIINTNRHFWFKFKDQSIGTEELKQKSNKEKLKILSKVGFEQEKEFNIPQALQKTQINNMKQYINIQSHTMFHPILPKCVDKEAYEEIFYSKEDLEKKYNIKVNAIAYPNGDYSQRDIRFVKKAGYKCGITYDYGFNTVETDLFSLKRISVNDTINIDELIVKSSGVWSFFKTLNGRYQKHGFTDKVEK